eukprot:TRINITY_DN1350_c0_g1_i1.p1 TRINITY_DN1350_c0_g1~~TRINITY_DN1350_c0_g1_i1.p1  ORF type:complete len:571 (-),score=61.37 TRINITY_DN1350_c0_g1_i1:267-1979(-)
MNAEKSLARSLVLRMMVINGFMWWLAPPILCITIPLNTILIIINALFKLYNISLLDTLRQVLLYTTLFSNGIIVLFQTGGIRSPGMMVIPGMPLFLYLHGVKSPKLTLFFSLLVIFGFYFLELLGIELEYTYHEKVAHHNMIFFYSILSVWANTQLVSELHGQSIELVSTITDKFKSEFISNMTHEIRTPLTTIIGWTDLLLSSSLQDPHYVRSVLTTVQHSSNLLLSLVNDILDWSKIDMGKFRMEVMSFNLHDLVSEVFNSFDVLMQKKGIYFQRIIDLPNRSNFRGDQYRIVQCLNNLLTNAQKFTSNGTVTLICREIGNASNGVSQIEFIVRDTGIGMNRETTLRISKFEPFTQGDQSTTRLYGGTGLGLSITQQLIKLMGGGGLIIDSQLGKGTQFSFILPLYHSYESPGPIKINPANTCVNLSIQHHGLDLPTLILPRGSLNILLVEDNLMNQTLVKKMLENLNHSCTIASNGEIAVNLCSQRSFSIILMDIMMPVMGGLEATSLIRSHHGPCQHVPIVGLTACADVETREHAIHYGMNDIVSKPLTMKKLQSVIQRVYRSTPS